MAAKKAPLTAEQVFPPLQQIQTFSEEPDEGERDINEVLGELGGIDDAKVSIYKSGNGKDARGGEFVDTVHPSEFSLQWLRDTYGGGTYRVHIRSNGRLLGNRLVKIAESLKKPEIVQDSGIKDLAETMQRGFMQLGELLVKSMEMGRVPQVDPNQTQTALLNNMLLMKQILAPAVAPQTQQTDPVQMLLKGIELANSLKGDTPIGDREPGSTDILMKAIETFGAPIANAVSAANSMGMAPQMTALPPPQAQMQANPQPTQPQQNTGDFMAGFKQYANMLELIAREDRDPFVYANLVADNAPREQLNEILSQPDVVVYLAQFNHNLGKPELRPWLEEFIGALKEVLTPLDNSATVSQGATNMTVNNATIGQQTITFPVGRERNPDNSDA